MLAAQLASPYLGLLLPPHLGLLGVSGRVHLLVVIVTLLTIDVHELVRACVVILDTIIILLWSVYIVVVLLQRVSTGISSLAPSFASCLTAAG